VEVGVVSADTGQSTKREKGKKEIKKRKHAECRRRTKIGGTRDELCKRQEAMAVQRGVSEEDLPGGGSGTKRRDTRVQNRRNWHFGEQKLVVENKEKSGLSSPREVEGAKSSGPASNWGCKLCATQAGGKASYKDAGGLFGRRKRGMAQ